MPQVRTHSGASRRSRLPALVAGITLLGGGAVVLFIVGRLDNEVREVRRLRRQLAERRAEVDRQRQELTAMAIAVDGLVPSARDLESRAMAVRQAGEADGSRAPRPEPGDPPTSAIGDRSAPGTMDAIATLAWVEARIAEADETFVTQATRVGRQVQDTRSVPTPWPVQGAVTSPFGWRLSPYGGDREWHRGVDITAPYGTPVRATADGHVIFAGRARGYGALVVVDHGATTTRYAHLSAIWVRAGQAVLRGEAVGALGGTGRATAPHLHYEVWLGSEPLDPACVLTGPAGTAFTQSGRWSHACAVVRARLEDRRARVTARDAARARHPA